MALCHLVAVSRARNFVALFLAVVFTTSCSTATSKSVVAPTPAIPAVLNPLPGSAPMPTAKMVAGAIAPLIAAPALGDHVGVAVADVATGAMLFNHSSGTAGDEFIPASTIKLFAAAAALLTKSPATPMIFESKTIALSNLVELTLTESDNKAAALLPTVISGSVAEVLKSRLPTLDLQQTVLADSSGLSRKNRTTPATLVRLLLLAAGGGNPQLGPILSGLPVSGFSGTLKYRAKDARGQIRAKTGTLTGVDVLSGYLVTEGKRLLAFTIMADQVPKTASGRKAIDAIATALLHLN